MNTLFQEVTNHHNQKDGSNKFAIDSNYNNTEVLADLQASQPIVKVFAARSKAKAKTTKREPVDLHHSDE